jgi:nitroreductase
MSDVFDIVRTTRSIRQFKNELLAEAVITQILEAGRLSGSAKNVQPWHFVAVQNRETLRALSECGSFAGHMAGAALGVALVTPDPFYRITVPFDLGRAAQNMMLTAWSLGVGSVMATIYQPDKAREILRIPSDLVVPWCISFGIPAQSQERPARKGGRRPTDEVIHREKW